MAGSIQTNGSGGQCNEQHTSNLADYVGRSYLEDYTKVGLATHPPPADPSEKAARKARATVIGFEREDDAHAFRRAFVRPNAQAT